MQWHEQHLFLVQIETHLNDCLTTLVSEKLKIFDSSKI